MIERCAGGVKLDFKKRCATCGAGPGDQCAKAALRDFEERQTLVKALNDILAANKDFRAGMPSDWEGDPLQDACDRATSVLDAVGDASRQGERS